MWRSHGVASTASCAGSSFSWLLFGSTGRDDAFITFQVAQSLDIYGFPLNINGENLEQSTSLGFALAIWILSWLPFFTVPSAAWVLGYLGLIAIGLLSASVIRETGASPLRTLVGSLCVVLAPPLLYWSGSGTEETWGVALMIAFLVQFSRESSPLVWTPLLWSCAFLFRPDLGLATLAGSIVGIALGWSKLDLRTRKVKAVILLICVGLLAVISLVRLFVTGHVFPYPIVSKVGGEPGLEAGFTYVWDNASTMWSAAVLIALAATLILFRPTWNLFDRITFLTLLILILGLIWSGGDWMEIGRLWAPPLALLTLVLFSLLAHTSSAKFGAVALALLVVQVAQTVQVVTTSSGEYRSTGSTSGGPWQVSQLSGSPGLWEEAEIPFNTRNAVRHRDSLFLAAAVPALRAYMNERAVRQVTVASLYAGDVAYYLRQEFGDKIRFIDLIGLTTDDFESCDIANSNEGRRFPLEDWTKLGDCAPPLPDVIFGSNPPDDWGYALAADVRGELVAWPNRTYSFELPLWVRGATSPPKSRAAQ